MQEEFLKVGMGGWRKRGKRWKENQDQVSKRELLKGGRRQDGEEGRDENRS